MVALVTVFTSCEKDEDPIVPEGITVEDLVGNWYFVSLEFEGNVYGDDVCGSEFDEDHSLVTMNLIDVTTTSFIETNNCNDGEINRSYTLSNDVITLDNGAKFQIMNATTFNGSELKLKLIRWDIVGMPVNGVYTLAK